MEIPEGHIAVLGPIIKPVYLGYYGLMDMVRNGGKRGYVYLDHAAVYDEEKTPDGLYWLYDVEDGTETLKASPLDAGKLFKSQKRFGLTAAEDIMLCVLTDVLLRHNVWASGSRYEVAGKVPDVCRGFDNRPELIWDRADRSYSAWGVPSCGSR
jgi:hypothetical protein